MPFGPDLSPPPQKKNIFSAMIHFINSNILGIHIFGWTIEFQQFQETKNGVFCRVGYLEWLLKKPKVYNERKKRRKKCFSSCQLYETVKH